MTQVLVRRDNEGLIGAGVEVGSGKDRTDVIYIYISDTDSAETGSRVDVTFWQ